MVKSWLYIFSLLSLSSFFLGSNEWELKKEQEGIKVYTKDAENSDIKQLRIVAEMDVQLHALLAALDDVPTHPEWVYRCKSAKKLDQDVNNGYYYYVTIDFPFPAMNRDIVIFTTKKNDLDTKRVITSSYAAPELYPEQDGYIRIKEFNSTYDISLLDNGKLLVTYEMFTDPGGLIPSWMVNMAISKGPIKTMIALEVLANDKKYQRITFEETK